MFLWTSTICSLNRISDLHTINVLNNVFLLYDISTLLYTPTPGKLDARETRRYTIRPLAIYVTLSYKYNVM